MKKNTAKTRSRRLKKASPPPRGSRQPADLAALREQITNLVRDQAVAMVETTIGEVDKGHYAAMKYLFEMIGLYPATAQEEKPGEDSLARTLLRRLGLPEEPMLENEVTKDCEPGAVEVAGDAVK
jgi:hypothetical protein